MQNYEKATAEKLKQYPALLMRIFKREKVTKTKQKMRMLAPYSGTIPSLPNRSNLPSNKRSSRIG